MLLQVHDELVLEIAPGEADRVEHLVRREMGSAAELRVPLDVSVGVAANWHGFWPCATRPSSAYRHVAPPSLLLTRRSGPTLAIGPCAARE